MYGGIGDALIGLFFVAVFGVVFIIAILIGSILTLVLSINLLALVGVSAVAAGLVTFYCWVAVR